MPQVGPRSLYFDVTGEIRTDRVKLPSCIRGGKPGALPNTQVCNTVQNVERCEPSADQPLHVSPQHVSPHLPIFLKLYLPYAAWL